ncbi:MAG: PIG-L family deacetylase [Ignavibacteriales bacterium]|nr:PIG-L family deacetylase [Ignavibacteriales bacterium]
MKKILLIILVLCVVNMHAQQKDAPPKVLVITAHPDDETGISVAIYKITHELKGTVDLALITNGEGGYKYSTLAEAYYGLPLTDEASGREYLPSIRKTELMNGGKIMGIRNYYFFDQKDHKYTLDITGVMDSIWDTVLVKRRLAGIIRQEKYNSIFCLLPVPETHAHHKCASLIALQLASELSEKERPTVLGYTIGMVQDSLPKPYTGLEGFPITRVDVGVPVFTIDRNAAFGFKNRLSYKVVANWVIAEHKSQGTMQLAMNMGDTERFLFFAVNPLARIPLVEKLFLELKKVPYVAKEYKE